MKRCPRSFSFGLVSTLLIFVFGCGRPTGSIAGRVSYKGNRLADGAVILVTAEGVEITARINRDGSYKAGNIPVGVVKVAVRSRGSAGLPPVLVPWVPDDVPVEPGAELPPSFSNAETSGLSFEVTSGEQTYDIILP